MYIQTYTILHNVSTIILRVFLHYASMPYTMGRYLGQYLLNLKPVFAISLYQLGTADGT